MLYVVMILALAIDQLTKYWASSSLAGKSVPVIQDVFHLTYLENTGAAFGMGQNNNWFFILMSFVILAVIIVLLLKYKPKEPIARISAGLIISGAVGNLIDRLVRGFVVDFLDFRLISFPVFNFADCCIVIGAVLFMVYIFFIYQEGDSHAKA